MAQEYVWGSENSHNGTSENCSGLNGNTEEDLCNMDKYFYILESGVNVFTESLLYLGLVLIYITQLSP